MNVVNIDFEHQAKWIVAEFLVDKRYEIIVRDWKWWDGQVDMIAAAGGSLVFIGVTACEGFPSDHAVDLDVERKRFEGAILKFIDKYDAVGCEVHADEVYIMLNVLARRAIVRHHVGIFGSPEAQRRFLSLFPRLRERPGGWVVPNLRQGVDALKKTCICSYFLPLQRRHRSRSDLRKTFSNWILPAAMPVCRLGSW